MRCRSVATTATVSKPKARSTVGNKATLEEKFRLRDKARPILRPMCSIQRFRPMLSPQGRERGFCLDKPNIYIDSYNEDSDFIRGSSAIRGGI